jgi:hypothetical protein
MSEKVIVEALTALADDDAIAAASTNSSANKRNEARR